MAPAVRVDELQTNKGTVKVVLTLTGSGGSAIVLAVAVAWFTTVLVGGSVTSVDSVVYVPVQVT
jgi:hypothetical protein